MLVLVLEKQYQKINKLKIQKFQFLNCTFLQRKPIIKFLIKW